jgi:hypothetical protein
MKPETLLERAYADEHTFTKTGKSGKFYYGICKGKNWSDDKPIYGVLVVTYNTKTRQTTREYDLYLGNFKTPKQAQEYADGLKEVTA